MTNVSQVERSLKHMLEERADVLARETGCIERQRKFSGADLLQTLVFGWLSHPDASLEALTSIAMMNDTPDVSMVSLTKTRSLRSRMRENSPVRF